MNNTDQDEQIFTKLRVLVYLMILSPLHRLYGVKWENECGWWTAWEGCERKCYIRIL